MQDGAARAYGPKVWKTLMSIDISRNDDDKVREDLNMRSGFCDACEGQALALRGAGGRFFSVPCERQALAIAPSSWPSCPSWPSCFRRDRY